MVKLRFRIGHLLIAVAVAAVCVRAFVWHQFEPPPNRMKWKWSVSRFNPTDHTSIIYCFESYGERSKPPTIAYLARMHVSPNDFPVAFPPRWLKDEDGRLLINGRNVPYDTGQFQLYVGDSVRFERRIPLNEKHAAFFDPSNRVLPDFDAIDQLWVEVVARD